jgi:hypothetical protein
MYSGNPYQLQQALEELARHGRDRNQAATRAAHCLYRRTRRQGWLNQFWSLVSGRGQHPFDLRRVEANHRIDNRFDVGRRTVALCQIRGSEGRCHDFDASFRPLRSHCAARWLGVAIARKMDTVLPPIDLIQVRDVYYVRDGHHRVSVGQAEIEAQVTVWKIANALEPVPPRPTAVERANWLAPQFWSVLTRLGLFLVALGGRLVARGLPPYHPVPGAGSGRQPGAHMA